MDLLLILRMDADPVNMADYIIRLGRPEEAWSRMPTWLALQNNARPT
jgi:hypothetical protein